MEKLKSLSYALTKNISLIIIAFSVLAFIRPAFFAWAVRYTAVFLGTAMFGMGLTISADDFRVVFSHPKEVIAGVIAQYTVMPLTAWVLCTAMHLPSDIALGVILVGCCPGGTASNVITYIAKGDVPLSVGMTIVSTLISPLATPLLVYALAGKWVSVSLIAMVITVVKIILIPVLLGILANKLFSSHVEKAYDALPLISVAAITLIIAGIVATNRDKIFAGGFTVIAVVAIHNLVGMALGLLVARMIKTDYKKSTAIAIEVGMQNSGLAISLATVNFAASPLATLPGAVFSVWHNLAGSAFAAVRERHADDE